MMRFDTVLRGRFAVVSLLSFVSLLALPSSKVEAQSNGNGISIGIGVAGGLKLLNELSKSAKTKKGKAASKKATEKKAYSSKSKNGGRSTASKNKGQSKENDNRSADSAKAEVQREPNPSAAAATPGASSAASLAAAGAAAGPASATPLISSKSEIIAAQDHLRYLGYDVPANSGTLDLNTKIAIMKYQESIGAEPTGAMTVEQLQSLFLKAAEKQKAK